MFKKIITLLIINLLVFFGCSLNQKPLSNVHPKEVKLKTGILKPTSRTNEKVLTESERNTVYVVLQFKKLPTPDYLKKQNINTVYLLGENTIIASVPKSFKVRSLTGLVWLGELNAELKISQIAIDKINLLNKKQPQTFIIEAYEGVEEQELMRVLSKYEITIKENRQFPKRIKMISVQEKQIIEKIAEENIIYYISSSKNDTSIYYCPGPVTEYGYIAHYAIVGNGWDDQGQLCVQLNYHFINGTNDISNNNERTAIGSAPDVRLRG